MISKATLVIRLGGPEAGRMKCTRNMQLLRADSDSARSAMTCPVGNFQPVDVAVRCHGMRESVYVMERTSRSLFPQFRTKRGLS